MRRHLPLTLLAGAFFTATAIIAVVVAIAVLGSPTWQTTPQIAVYTVTPSQLAIAALFDTTPIYPTLTPSPSTEPTTISTPVSGDITPESPDPINASPDATAAYPVFPVATSVKTGCQPYTVQQGDTLVYIAALSNIGLDDLLRANGLTVDDGPNLQIGQELTIPLQGCKIAQPTARPAPTAVRKVIRATSVAASSGDTARSGESGGYDLSRFRLYIPSLRINLPVTRARFVGVTWDFAPITYSAAYLDGLAMPGRGNVVIGAHSELTSRRPGPFYSLGRIKVGDEIVVTYSGGLYRYRVERIWTVVPTDLGPIDQGVGDVLTLLTCDGYNGATGDYDTRIIVRAVRVS